MKTAFAFVLMFAVLVGLSYAQMGVPGGVSCSGPPYTGGKSYTPKQNGYQFGARVSVGEPPERTYTCRHGHWY